MRRSRKIILVVAVAIVGVVGWFACRILNSAAHIPEAYAAWDTGTLLVEYVKVHDDRWPASWDELLTVLDSDAGRQIPLRGAQAGDLKYARALRDKVKVDWSFDPTVLEFHPSVSRHDGSPFPVLWEDPNEMVLNHFRERASTRSSAVLTSETRPAAQSEAESELRRAAKSAGSDTVGRVEYLGRADGYDYFIVGRNVGAKTYKIAAPNGIVRRPMPYGSQPIRVGPFAEDRWLP